MIEPPDQAEEPRLTTAIRTVLSWIAKSLYIIVGLLLFVVLRGEIVVEPFLFVGLIAVVRRILIITAELERQSPSGRTLTNQLTVGRIWQHGLRGGRLGTGKYETAAAELEPVAHTVLDRASVAAGEDVVDLACGTGNAALLAAARGARVIGVDAAPRLLEVARGRAQAQGVRLDLRAADLLALPIDDAAATLSSPSLV